jgi:uncharacterized membrane protein YuzA (DUF378 family)
MDIAYYQGVFRWLSISFYLLVGCFFSYALVHELFGSQVVSALWLIITVASGLTYMSCLMKLVAGANKSCLTWFVGTILFGPVSLIASFVNIRAVAIRNGWAR